MYGHANTSNIDTTPGAGTAFSPPAGFTGDYRRFMRQRWKTDPWARQQVQLAARFLITGLVSVVFTGCYAEEARQLAMASK